MKPSLRGSRIAVSFLGVFLLAGFHLSLLRGQLRGQEPPIVYSARVLQSAPSRVDAVERATSGSLRLHRSGQAPQVLVDAKARVPGDASTAIPLDVMDPDVSYDGSRIVFAGFSPENAAWRIYEIGADGKGLRKITQSDRQTDLARYGAAAQQLKTYDDVDPCYLPDGRLCFVSTRYPEIAPDKRLRATNLYLVNSDGSDVHRITTERMGADTPAVDPSTGKIVYSRFWRTPQAKTDPAADPPPPIPPGSPGYGGGENNGGPSQGPAPPPAPTTGPRTRTGTGPRRGSDRRSRPARGPDPPVAFASWWYGESGSRGSSPASSLRRHLSG